MADQYTAILADDHDIVRDGLRAAMEKPGLIETDGIRVVAETANGFETLAAVKLHKPDLVILDLTMPLSGGAEVLTDIRRWSPNTKVVVYSSVDAPGILSMLIEAGVEGMFHKGGSNAALYEKLPLILRGGRYVAPECLERVEGHDGAIELTPREQQALHMILAGRTTQDIADGLGISPRTAEKHRASLMAKLDVRSVTELMARALRDGLINPT